MTKKNLSKEPDWKEKLPNTRRPRQGPSVQRKKLSFTLNKPTPPPAAAVAPPSPSTAPPPPPVPPPADAPMPHVPRRVLWYGAILAGSPVMPGQYVDELIIGNYGLRGCRIQIESRVGWLQPAYDVIPLDAMKVLRLPVYITPGIDALYPGPQAQRAALRVYVGYKRQQYAKYDIDARMLLISPK